MSAMAVVVSVLTRIIAVFALQQIWTVTLANGSEQCVSGREGTNCSFFEDMCKWESQEWKVRNNFLEISLDTHNFSQGSLRSPLLCSTGWGDHCLVFHYEFLHQLQRQTTLAVLLQVEGQPNPVRVWNLADNSSGQYPGTAPIKTTGDFQIIFQASRPTWNIPGAGSYIKIYDVSYKITECSVSPVDATAKPPTSRTSPKTAAPIVQKTTSPRLPLSAGPQRTRIAATSSLPVFPTSTAKRKGRKQTSSSMPDSLGVGTSPARIKTSTESSSSSDKDPNNISVVVNPSGILISAPSDESDGDRKSFWSSGAIILTVVGVIGAMVVVGVLLIVAKRNRLLCFRSPGERWKEVQLGSWHLEDPDIDTGSGHSAGNTHAANTNMDTDLYNVIDGNVIYTTPDTTTTTTTTNDGNLKPFLPPIYTVVNKAGKGEKSGSLNNRLLERRRSSHQQNTLPLLRNTREHTYTNSTNASEEGGGGGSVTKPGAKDDRDYESVYSPTTNMAANFNSQSETGSNGPGVWARKGEQCRSGEKCSPAEEQVSPKHPRPDEGYPSPKHSRSDDAYPSPKPSSDSGRYHADDPNHYHLPEKPVCHILEENAGTGDYDVPDSQDSHLPGGYAIPETSTRNAKTQPTAEEEYNCLGFATGSKGGVKGEGGGKVYDSLGGGEGEMYSHVQRDRKPLVIDQVYSHLC
ncbi:hypothetical protein ACOMHN_029078 [Nucella lapillus]